MIAQTPCSEILDLQAARFNYPRVSEILDSVMKFEKDAINPEVLERACERGTNVHAQISAKLLNLFEMPVDEEIGAYVKSFEMWKEEQKSFHCEAVEKRLFDDTARYSGKMDAVLRFSGETGLVLVDYKTSSTFSKRWPLQLTAYVHLLWNNGYPIHNAQIIHLKVKKTTTEEGVIFEPKKPKVYNYDLEDLAHYGKLWQSSLEIFNYYHRKS